MRTGFLIFIFLTVVSVGWTSPRTEVKRGNQLAGKGAAEDAMIHYKRALEMNGDSSVVLYDIGNLLYEQGDYKSAMQFYGGSVDQTESERKTAETLYNLGNTLFQQQEYEKAAAAYIESLKRNPVDEQAKYNLELAKLMLRQQQQQQQQNQQQEQKKDQPEQQKQDSTQQQPQPQQQNQQPEQEQQQNQPQQDQQMSKDEAERLLNALLQDEQNALKDAKKVKVAAKRPRERDW